MQPPAFPPRSPASIDGLPLRSHIDRARRRDPGDRLWHVLARRLRRDRRDRAQARLSPHRHGLEIRHRARRRRRHARVRRAARRDFPDHQGVARISAHRRFRALGRREPRRISASTTSISCSCIGRTRRFRSSEPIAALAKAKRQGLARHIGVANFNIALLDEAIRLCPEPLVDAAGRVSRPSRPDQADRGLPASAV